MNYIAWKGLYAQGERILSPSYRVAWEEKECTPYGARLCLEAWPGDLDTGRGVFAATAEEAAGYSHLLYLVAPVPGTRIVPGLRGWRAEAAFVVDGPFSQPDELDVKRLTSEGHRTIIWSALAGYEFVPGVLLESFYSLREELSEAEAVEVAGLIAPCINDFSFIGYTNRVQYLGMGFVMAVLRRHDYLMMLADTMAKGGDPNVGDRLSLACLIVSALSYPVWEEDFVRECILRMRMYPHEASCLLGRLGEENIEAVIKVLCSGYDHYGDEMDGMMRRDDIRNIVAGRWAASLDDEEMLKVAGVEHRNIRAALIRALSVRTDRALTDKCMKAMFPTAEQMAKFFAEMMPQNREDFASACSVDKELPLHSQLARILLTYYSLEEVAGLVTHGYRSVYKSALYALELAVQRGLIDTDSAKRLIPGGAKPSTIEKCVLAHATNLAIALQKERRMAK